MHFLKQIALFFSKGFLRLGLLLFAILLPLATVFGTPEPIKDIVKSAGLYDLEIESLITNAIEDESRDIQSLNDGQELSVDDPYARDALARALPPQRIQEVVEQVIDGTYVWLQGDAEYPAFTLSFEQDKQRFITTLADNVMDRVAGLEPCTQEQLLALKEFDPLTVPCRPPLNLEQQKQQYIAELNSNTEFLQDTTVSGQELIEEIDRYDGPGAADIAPAAFGVLDLLVPVALITGLFGAAVIFLSETKRKGTRTVAITLIGVGIMVIISTLIIYFLAGKASGSTGTDANEAVQNTLINIAMDLRTDLAILAFIVSGIYMLLGSIALIVLRRKKSSDAAKEHHEPDANTQGADSTSAAAQAETASRADSNDHSETTETDN